jgi:arsenate reductase
MCVANSARSQMAEGIARKLASADTVIFSAGSTPAGVNPLARRAMSEIGIDISGHYSKTTEAIPIECVDYVITLCAEEVCPYVPANVTTLHWPYPDPAGAGQSEEEALAGFRAVRDALKVRLESFLDSGSLRPERVMEHE